MIPHPRSDIGSGRLRKITPDQKSVVTLPGMYNGALGLDVDSYGRLYVANTDLRQLLSILFKAKVWVPFLSRNPAVREKVLKRPSQHQ